MPVLGAPRDAGWGTALSLRWLVEAAPIEAGCAHADQQDGACVLCPARQSG